MGQQVAISGTTSSHGGVMISSSGSGLQVAGRPVCRVGDSHSCPIPGHGVTPIVSGGATKAIVSGVALAISGSVAGCGAVLDGSFASNISVV